MPNMKSVIQNNTNLLSKHTTLVAAHSCSCCQKSVCPLNNECSSESLVFKAAVSQTPSQINKYYYGTCEKTFKERYNNLTATFRNISKKKSTELIIASRARPYNDCTRKYDPFLTKKLMIVKPDPSFLLNTCDEFISECRHMNKFALKCFKISQL